MDRGHPERRGLTRLPLEVFVRIKVVGGTDPNFAKTHNVSASGLFFHTYAPLAANQEVECVLVLPERLTQAPNPILVGCQGRVLRVNQLAPGEQLGVAVEIHSYDFSWQESLAETLAKRKDLTP